MSEPFPSPLLVSIEYDVENKKRTSLRCCNNQDKIFIWIVVTLENVALIFCYSIRFPTESSGIIETILPAMLNKERITQRLWARVSAGICLGEAPSDINSFEYLLHLRQLSPHRWSYVLNTIPPHLEFLPLDIFDDLELATSYSYRLPFGVGRVEIALCLPARAQRLVTMVISWAVAIIRRLALELPPIPYWETSVIARTCHDGAGYHKDTESFPIASILRSQHQNTTPFAS